MADFQEMLDFPPAPKLDVFVTSRIGPEGKREWNSLANQQTGGEPAARRTRCTKDLQRFNCRMRQTARPVVWEGHGAQSP